MHRYLLPFAQAAEQAVPHLSIVPKNLPLNSKTRRCSGRVKHLGLGPEPLTQRRRVCMKAVQRRDGAAGDSDGRDCGSIKQEIHCCFRQVTAVASALLLKGAHCAAESPGHGGGSQAQVTRMFARTTRMQPAAAVQVRRVWLSGA